MCKKVSVVVPCYNAAMYLDKCLEYLLHQTIGIENIEIILVNDASTDNGATWNLITEYEQRFPDTIMAVDLEENLRQGGARNVGVSYAGGEYLIFCDADDWLLEETLEHCYRIAKEYDTDVVEFLINDIHDHDMTVPLEKGDGDFLIDLAVEEARGPFLLYIDTQLTLGSQKKFYRTSLIQDNKIVFAEHVIFEEPSFVLPVRLYEKKHYFLDEKLYICFLSQGSTVRSDWEKKHKWDNPKVWMTLVADLTARGLLAAYHDEIEYLFFTWGLGLSIRMIMRKGYELTKEEFKFLADMTLTLFPNVRQNKYVMVSVNDITSVDDKNTALLWSLLGMEITDKTAQEMNALFKQCL